MGKQKNESDKKKNNKTNLKQKELKTSPPEISLSQTKNFMNKYYIYLKQNLPFERNQNLLNKYNNQYTGIIERLLNREKDTELHKIEPDRKKIYDQFYSISNEKDRIICLSLLSNLI